MNTNNHITSETPQAVNSRQPFNLNTREGLFLDAQSKLLGLVGDFMQLGAASGPIETINELLYTWLDSADLSLMANQNHLTRAFETVNFLAHSYEEYNRMRIFSDVEPKEGSQPIASPDPVSVPTIQPPQSDIEEAKEDLLDVVGRYMNTVSPIKALNKVVDTWASSPTVDLATRENKLILSQILELTSFLATIGGKYEVVRMATEASSGQSIGEA